MAISKFNKAFIHCKAILPNEIMMDATVACLNERIVSVHRDGEYPLDSCEIVDLHHQYLCPGFVDIHVHGGAGFDFMDGSLQAVERICECHLKHGTTTLYPTTTTATCEEILDTIAACQAYQTSYDHHRTQRGSRLGGMHLYGPYFSPEKSGCHNPSQCRPPYTQEFDRYFTTGMIRVATCAAELEGAAEFYMTAAQHGCLITCGHSNATWNEMDRAFALGMRHVDHFWCAMSMVNTVRTRLGVPMQGSMLEYVLANKDMSTEVIADGAHLAPELLRFAYQMKGSSRLCLVTDCSRALDMPPGEYRFGSASNGPLFRSDGHVGWASNGGLASSVRGMDHMVRHAYQTMGAPLFEVIRMASLTPAELVGSGTEIGSIAPGKLADLVVLDDSLNILQVYLGAQQSYSA